jgi:hypothetical protein
MKLHGNTLTNVLQQYDTISMFCSSGWTAISEINLVDIYSTRQLYILFFSLNAVAIPSNRERWTGGEGAGKCACTLLFFFFWPCIFVDRIYYCFLFWSNGPIFAQVNGPNVWWRNLLWYSNKQQAPTCTVRWPDPLTLCCVSHVLCSCRNRAEQLQYVWAISYHLLAPALAKFHF